VVLTAEGFCREGGGGGEEGIVGVRDGGWEGWKRGEG